MRCMDPDRWQRIEDALDRLFELEDAVDIEAAVRELCSDDPEIHQEVLELARAARQTTGVLKTSLLKEAPDLLDELQTLVDGPESPTDGERIIGSYRLLELIGRGGMGVVYLAERADGQFEKRVAIKLMPRGLETPEMERRFRVERQILADLEHPGIARLLDGGVTDEGHPYLVMELVEGRTLVEDIPEGGVSLQRFFEIAIPLAETLAVAHGHGIIHRDLKPANIMVTSSGALKVLDFGVAKRQLSAVEVSEDAPTKTMAQLTQDGRIVGTVPYMSPEQLRSVAVDPRTDLFSLGVILFELIADSRPFQGDTVLDLISSILREQPPDLGDLRPEIPGQLVALIEHCLAKDREARIASASDLHDRLVALQKTTLGPSKPGESDRQELDPRAVAVLPFVRLSSTDEAEFLASGLHNDLITELSKIPGLTVISRTSVMGYHQTEKPMPQIARELGVGTIVEGAVQTAANRVRLTAQLVDAVADAQRWAESYDRELSAQTLFSIQSELTKRIVESLQSKLTPDQELAVGKRQTEDLEAYRLCSLGRMQFDRKTEAGFRRAIEHFEQAVERDPDYVLAWVGLADSQALMEDYGYGNSEVLLARAKEAADRALELDPDSAEAHTSLGLFYSSNQDGPATLREWELAVQIQPGYADAHNWLSWISLLLGRAGRALESIERAVELNPLSAEAVSNLSLSCLTNGERERALAEARRAAELSPGWTTASFYEGLALYHLQRFEEASSVLGDLTVEWTGLGAEAALALAHQAGGNEKAAREVLARIDPNVDAFAVGFVHLALGEVDTAFEWFSKVDQLGPWPTLAVHHLYGFIWDNVRDDPRYEELVRHAYASWGLDPCNGRSHE